MFQLNSHRKLFESNTYCTKLQKIGCWLESCHSYLSKNNELLTRKLSLNTVSKLLECQHNFCLVQIAIWNFLIEWSAISNAVCLYISYSWALCCLLHTLGNCLIASSKAVCCSCVQLSSSPVLASPCIRTFQFKIKIFWFPRNGNDFVYFRNQLIFVNINEYF